MTDQQLTRLARRYQQALAATGVAAGSATAAAWDQLTSWDEADVEEFIKAAGPAVEAARQHGSYLAAAFVSLAAGISTPTITQLAPPDLRAPFLAYWASLANGTPWDQAHTAGRNQAEATGFDNVQSAAREATTTIDRAEPSITGWQRIPDAGACDWCLLVAQQTYHTAETADFGHDRCGCSVAPA